MARRTASTARKGTKLARVEPTRGVVRPSGAIAVTGVNTFLGRSIVALLEQDRAWRRIVAIDLRNTTTAGAKTRFYRVDLTQPAVDAHLAEILEAERVDTVLHAAFVQGSTHATAWAHELESVGTMHTLAACEQHRVRKLVLWSHTMLYGALPGNPMYLSEQHPLRGDRRAPFVGDRIDAEEQVGRFAERHPATVVTVLRVAPTLGPAATDIATDLLRRRVVPTVLGYDPLVQFVHELDAVAAFGLVLGEDHRGTFNIVAPGVMPFSTALRLAGKLEVWLPLSGARPLLSALYGLHLTSVAPVVLEYLRFPFVASGDKAERELGFRASYSTREALADFVRSRRHALGRNGRRGG